MFTAGIVVGSVYVYRKCGDELPRTLHALFPEVLTPSGVQSVSPPPLASDETTLPPRCDDPPPLPLVLPPHQLPLPGPLGGSLSTPLCPLTSDQNTISPQAVVSLRMR